MESPSIVCGMPFRQEPRSGQRVVFEALNSSSPFLNIQLPTGYGKTFTAAGCYSIKQQRGEVNRLLVIFPTDAQLQQFQRDNDADETDFWLAGLRGPSHVVDIRFSGVDAIKQHRSNRAQIFAITVQALLQAHGREVVRDLLETSLWMIVVDEYHHYGLDRAWTHAVRSLPAQFLLAMSATPRRMQNDSAFGDPHVKVSYRQAAKEGFVKSLQAHAYDYRIETIGYDGGKRSFTTKELIQEVGSDVPEQVDRWVIERRMRWSPKYVSPLVAYPLERLIRMRTHTGHTNLQALIGAMCVSHAELVCDQVRAMFPDLSVDWVGTGPNGRSDADNDKVLKRFCPQKQHGRRSPTLDVLVHVGMAGEGLDSTFVTEIIHLNRANRNNTNDQENGRAARLLVDAAGRPVIGNINVDATSDYAAFTGDRIMDAMDGCDPIAADEPDEAPDPSEPREFDPLPDDPVIAIYDMELEQIDSGSPGVQRMATVLTDVIQGFSREDLDERSPRHDELLLHAVNLYRAMRRQEADEHNERSRVTQAQQNVGYALTAVVGAFMRRLKKHGELPVDDTAACAGRAKWAINTRKKQTLGPIGPDVALCERHYRWLKTLELDILADRIPQWLSSSILGR